jgi:hypothetical protein
MPVTDPDGKPFVRAATGGSLAVSGRRRRRALSESDRDCGKKAKQLALRIPLPIMAPPHRGQISCVDVENRYGS